MKSTIHHFFSFNAKKRNWVNWLNGMTYGGSGKPSQQRKLISLIWFVGGVSWSAHNSLSFNQKKFDWLKRIDCRPSSFSPASLKNKKFFIFRCRPQRLQSQSLFQSIFPLGREDWWKWKKWMGRAVQPSSSIIKQINFTLLNCFIV